MAQTISSEEFNRRAQDAMRAAESGPVIIVDGDRPTHVLLTYEAFQQLDARAPTLPDLLAMPGVEDVDFDPPKLVMISRPVDL